MPDNKDKTGAQDRNRVAGNQDYEIQYMADALNTSAEEVKKAVAAVGNDREKVAQYLRDKGSR